MADEFVTRIDENGVLSIYNFTTSDSAAFALKSWWEKFSNNIPGATLRIQVCGKDKTQVFEQTATGLTTRVPADAGPRR